MPYTDKEKRKEYNREYNRVYMRESRLANGEKFRERERARREADPAQRLLYSTKQSAKKKGIEHTITKDDLQMPVTCPYLGIKIDYTAGNGKTMEKPSVDRIDPSIGYVPGNVEVMSSLANTMKNRATQDQLVSFAREVLRRYE